MSDERWDVVPESDVLTLAGLGARIYRMPLASYVLGPDAFIVIVEPGDRPDGTAVQHRELLKLAGPFPDEVHTYLYNDLMGTAGHRPETTPSALHGFVRVREGCQPLGPLKYCGGSYDPTEERLIEYQIHLEQVLPFEVLDRVRPLFPAPPPPRTSWLDLLPDDPVAATHEFVTDWYADVPTDESHAEASHIPIPAPLAAFYATVAGRKEVLGRQDPLFPLHKLRLDKDGWLEFGAENQGGFVLAIDPTATDPAVSYRYWTDEPIIDPHPLSTFLLLFALYEASFAGPYLAFAHLTTEEAQRLTYGLRRVPLRNRWVPSTDTEFHVGNGLVVQLTPREDSTWYAYTSARHRAHLEALRHLDIRWGIFEG
ncbi:hypothetical protein [Planotetraspora mira]|uniref:Uncharacterized protein n=1 Tax=Planotetraspora mira TaxID=58121 RepID=A0A8J3XAJ2_9ACTN|nr:hypothetical protein [Planotetraspora mira]GII33561.1 hypothetical protein Pmi06nite_70030 [Planotetraspora mira]